MDDGMTRMTPEPSMVPIVLKPRKMDSTSKIRVENFVPHIFDVYLGSGIGRMIDEW